MRSTLGLGFLLLWLLPGIAGAQDSEPCVLPQTPAAAIRHAVLSHTLSRSDEDIQDLRFSRDGTRLAVGQNDRRVRVWDVATGAMIMESRELGGPLWNVGFTDDGERVVSYSPEGDEINLHVWTIATGRGERTDDWSLSYGLLAPSRTIGARSRDGTRQFERTRLFNPETGADIMRLGSFLGSATAEPYFSFDSSTLVLRYGVEAHAFNASTGQRTARLCGAVSGVPEARSTPDGRYLVGPETSPAREPDRIAVWDTHTGAIVARVRAPDNSVWGIDISPDGSMIATGSRDGRARIWRLEAGSGEEPLIESAAPEIVRADDPSAIRVSEPRRSVRGVHSVRSLSVSPDRSSVAFLSENGDASIWRIGASSTEIVGRSPEHFALSVGAPCPQWATIDDGASVSIRNWRNGRVERTLPPPDEYSEVLSVQGGANCDQALITFSDGSVELWNVRTGSKLHRLMSDEWPAEFASYDKNSNALLVVSENSVLTLSIETRRVVTGAEIEGIEQVLAAYAFGDDGRVLLWGSGGLAIWDRERGAMGKIPFPAPLGVMSNDGSVVAFTSGIALLAGGSPSVINLDGQAHFDLMSARFQTTSLAISADGALVAAGASNGLIRVWKTADGRLTAVLGTQGPAVRSLSFAGDNLWLYAGDAAGTIREWQVPRAD
jgi:WD40 repeat protein